VKSSIVFLVAGLCSAVPAVLAGKAPPLPSDTRARELIATLHLEYLPGESGYFGLVSRSAQKVTVAGRENVAQSQIYYLLTSELPLNYLHWLAPDDTHVLIEGGPVDYFIFHPDGRTEKITLGRDVAAGQRLIVAVPGGCWKALRLHPGAHYALIANVLSPGWTPEGVKIGARADFITRFRNAAPWATASLLRELIGPNYDP
jgi:predicted cupin superfamily sugar epimerase